MPGCQDASMASARLVALQLLATDLRIEGARVKIDVAGPYFLQHKNIYISGKWQKI